MGLTQSGESLKSGSRNQTKKSEMQSRKGIPHVRDSPLLALEVERAPWQAMWAASGS